MQRQEARGKQSTPSHDPRDFFLFVLQLVFMRKEEQESFLQWCAAIRKAQGLAGSGPWRWRRCRRTAAGGKASIKTERGRRPASREEGWWSKEKGRPRPAGRIWACLWGLGLLAVPLEENQERLGKQEPSSRVPAQSRKMKGQGPSRLALILEQDRKILSAQQPVWCPRGPHLGCTIEDGLPHEPPVQGAPGRPA